ncbi:NitT/TauT family transport system substrate-binding protein [Acetivibrio thermocellus AD2]|uniref:NitT/TauT family transport system substrate-binding protein n=1 Tax=Acetivibrio thermocellus AD2 TaxID=1138384 RepID=A0AB36TCT7_ACETH|nr:ABC transporter substrate-binding protein [Acetivibrio thermocellus]ADU73467.1 extracellular solute-binding protein family 3 [Acetivibrio thermocellus DSM 1313]ALX07389.1 ABC-type transporter, periplasmic subunit family 3 [Acetivibrio thermocellus AD2]ANV75128.1 ABC-type transporter, periplasmic subunit family 3 [Acetivibrio thermocellus DSM 2360]EIC04144.1 ABC-type transporter, periplasmic subunit family 3 [Acetivibrio thermocellus YS]PFH01653.1 NitT/TauT family transport system substrate-
MKKGLRMKKKILTGIISFLITSILLSGCGGQKVQKTNLEDSGTGRELKKFKVGYLASPGHVLYFVAKEKGFFEEEGLDVELFLFTNSGEGLNAISSGKVDVGSFGTAAPLTFISKGTDFVIFGGQQTEGHGIVALPQKAKELTDLNSFKGKTIATVRLATGDVIFRAALSEAGIDWKNELTINELDSPAAVLEAVKKGSVDAGIVWTPFIKLGEKQGLEIVKYSGELVKMHTCCRQVALSSNIKENKEDFVRFMAALIKAYKFYMENQDETVDIIAKYAKVDKDIIKEETYGGHIYSIPDPDKEGVIRFWDLINKSGYISSDLNIEDFIDTSIYKLALEDVLKEYPNDEVYKKLKADFKE